MADNIGKIASFESPFSNAGITKIAGFADVDLTSWSSGEWDFSCTGDFSASAYILCFVVMGFYAIKPSNDGTQITFPSYWSNTGISRAVYAYAINVHDFPKNSLCLMGDGNSKMTWYNCDSSMQLEVTSSHFKISGNDDYEPPYYGQAVYGELSWIVMY